MRLNAGNVVGITIYESGDVVVKRAKPWVKDIPNNGKKKPLYYLSAKSRNRMLFVLKNTSIRFHSMFCLSYPESFPTNGSKVKRDLNRWLEWYRRTITNVPYFWFLEFQRRSAPHVHLYIAERRANLPQSEMAAYWANIVCPIDTAEWAKVNRVHGHARQLQDFRTREGSLHYATKYALKTYQKSVPKNFSDVGRFWGCSRSVTDQIQEGVYVEMTERALEEHLYATNHRCKTWDMVPKIIFDCFT